MKSSPRSTGQVQKLEILPQGRITRLPAACPLTLLEDERLGSRLAGGIGWLRGFRVR